MGLVTLSLVMLVACMAAEPSPHRRILGGTPVNLAVDPVINFQVGLEIVTRKGSVNRCGGSIIGPQHVLTAAHCLWDQPSGQEISRPGLITVIPGIDFNSRGNAVTASAYWVHSTYIAGPSIPQQDIAVIRVSRNFTFGASIGSITLSNGANCVGCETDTPSPTQYFVSGYGYTVSTASGGSGLSNQLLYVEQQFVTSFSCLTRLQLNAGTTTIGLPQNVICAGPVPAGTANKDSCQGDSGGPLFVQFPVGTTPRYVQVGIVSVSTEQADPFCGVSGDFGIYTGVRANNLWVANAMNGVTAPTAAIAAALVPALAAILLVLLTL